MHRRMQAVYGDPCVDVSTVRRWVRRFKGGEMGFKNKTNFFFNDRFQKLVQLWWKCIEMRGDFVENYYAALKITDIGVNLSYFIKISFPVHFLFKWRQYLSARPCI